MHEELSDDERMARLTAALAMLEGIKPGNELEGMLAAQMVGTHSAAMEILRRARWWEKHNIEPIELA